MPDYNWREHKVLEQHFVATMPGKAASMTRSIDLDGLKVVMTMQGVKVNDVTYTIASVPLPDDSAATHTKILKAMQAGMLKNISGKVAVSVEQVVAVIDASDKKVAQATGQRITAVGVQPSAAGQSATFATSAKSTDAAALAIHALFIARKQLAWQVVVLGPEAELKKPSVLETAKQLIDSFRIVQ